MKSIVLTVIALTFVPMQALSCSPVMPIIVPPKTPSGEFNYIYPPTELEKFIEALGKSKNFAVVRVYLDFHWQSYPHNAQTEFQVLYGWGDPQPEIVKMIRAETSCGEPKPLEIDTWYVAIFPVYRPPYLMPYKYLEFHISKFGKPEYVYTSIGLLPR